MQDRLNSAGTQSAPPPLPPAGAASLPPIPAEAAVPPAPGTPVPGKPPARPAKPSAKAAAAQPTAAQSADDAPEDHELFAGTAPSWQESFAAFGVSLVINGLILLVMAMFYLPEQEKTELAMETLVEEPVVVEEIVIDEIEHPVELDTSEMDEDPLDDPVPVESDSDAEADFDLDVNDMELAMVVESDTGPSLNIDQVKDIAGGRSEAARGAMLAARGGNSASDAAVAGGLAWLKTVQLKSGAWDFAEVGESKQPGTLKGCYTGATAMAVMAYLGAGHTHMKPGKYQETVKKGLNFLLASGKPTAAGLDFRGRVTGNEGMYVQGLVGITLAEAYGMSNDRRLRSAAEGCLRFISNAQDPKGGGWRYKPRQPGDTSVVGWMLMALKSGYFAKIPVERRITSGVVHFLDSVQSPDRSQYAYTPGGKPKPSTTSIGLLCRMYLGWKADHPALKEGVKYLSARGPASNDMYYNYYATQVMIQLTDAKGPVWEKWNTKMRDQLVKSQRKSGPEKGSWNVADTHGSRGGRIYMTCLAVMTLEVYYRVLPLYKRNSVQEDF